MPRPGDLIGNRYRIDTWLGRGGMGVAYAATNVVTGKKIALKWIVREGPAAQLQRVIREARAAGRVRHPNVVDVYDVGEHDGSLFLVMELLTGQSLQAVIAERGPLPSDELLRWLLPALRGVRAAHRRGVIHRDLKPANVFLCRDDAGEPLTAKVLDFGVSKIVSDTADPDDPSLTDSGALLGTPSYAAPEQLEGEGQVDQRADVYACGVILYHALAGRRPFEADSVAKLVVAIMTVQPVPLSQLRPDLSPGLCAIVERAMQRDPAQRFADMDGLIDALEGLDPPAAPREEAPAEPRMRADARARARPHVAWLVLGALSAVALATWWNRSAGTSERAARDSPRPPAAAAVASERVRAVEPVLEPSAPPAPAPVQPLLEKPAEVAAPQRHAGVPRGAPLRSPRPQGASVRPGSAAAQSGGIIELSSDDF